MPIRFTSRLLDHLRHDGYRPSTIRVIVKDLRITDEDRKVFDQAIREAQSEGIIEIGNDQCVRLPSLPDETTGKYRSNKRGFGFQPEDTPVGHHDMGTFDAFTIKAPAHSALREFIRHDGFKEKLAASD